MVQTEYKKSNYNLEKCQGELYQYFGQSFLNGYGIKKAVTELRGIVAVKRAVLNFRKAVSKLERCPAKYFLGYIFYNS